MSESARQSALEILLRIEQDGAYSNLILDKRLGSSSLSERDKSFAAILVYGVMEKKLLLDYNLARLCDRPLNRLDAPVRMILRMGLYQLFFMQSVTAAAAVNESVKLCKVNKLNSSGAFVNAVLRSASRLSTLQLPERRKGKNKYDSIRYSCPEPIVKLWREAYGDEVMASVLESLEGRPPLTARVNTLRTDTEQLVQRLAGEGIAAQPSFLKNYITLRGTGAPGALAAGQEGLFHIQDAACGICCGMLGVQPGETVIDACSAPGGKSFTLAQMMQNRGRIVACDLYENRLQLVAKGAQRLGITIIETCAGDAAQNQSLPQADRILCDVPCSGLGIIRRKPELRYKEDTGAQTLPAIQYAILSHCAGFLKKGGTLVYSTCTLNPAENDGVIRRFLEEHSDFAPAELELPQQVQRRIPEPSHELTLFPRKEGTDGFFIAKVVRTQIV